MRRATAVLRFSLALALLLGAAACDYVRDAFALQKGLTEEFGATSTSVHRQNGEHLTVTLEGPALNALTGEARSAAARRVAEYVRDHFGSYAELTDVTIVFGKTETIGPATYREEQSSFTFQTADLGPPAAKR